MLTGIAERTIRIKAVAVVKEGLVLQTSLKNEGRLANAENLSFKVTSAIYFYLDPNNLPYSISGQK